MRASRGFLSVLHAALVCSALSLLPDAYLSAQTTTGAPAAGSTSKLPVVPDATTTTLSSVSDGPYVVATADGGWEAWTVETAAAGLTKHAQPIKVGESITIQAVGSRPAFTVKLRKAAEPAPDEMAMPKGVPVFLMADSHGEFEICTELLIKQGVIDRNLNWSFGKGHLIVLGDIFDRGPRQTEILWLLYKLEAEAQEAGGGLHLNLGNHETMVLTGDVRYLNKRYVEAATTLGVKGYPELWSKNTLLGQWLRSKPAVFKFGNTLCLHGGISPKMVADKWTLPEINGTVRAWLNGDTSQDAARISFIKGNQGPMWHRGHIEKSDKPEDIAAAKAFYKVDRIAVGHTKVDTVRTLYDGDVIAVQVYPTEEGGKMNMEGAYINEKGVWHRATIDGTREVLIQIH